MPEQDQQRRERPYEEPAPWTPKEQSPFNGPRTRTENVALLGRQVAMLIA
jgi:hypothetical protein